jgi:dihydrolipoamide dehydrogenase
MPESFDLLVIGGGPGGYVAAIRAAQLGLRTACVEEEELLGGTCLRVGCIPSKALLESSEVYHRTLHGLQTFGVHAREVGFDLAAIHKRKDAIVRQLTRGIAGLFDKNGVQRVRGTARLLAPDRVAVRSAEGEETVWTARHVAIATGSVPATLPGVEVDGDRIGTSTQALAYPEVPGRLVVIGAGVIGLELGTVWSRLGSKVVFLEYADRILPGMDSEICSKARRLFERQGLEFRLGARVESARVVEGGCVVEVQGAPSLECDRVLLATGRRARTEGLGLEEMGVRTDERGRILVDQNLATSVPGVFALGDCTPGPMLAHKASEEGMALAEFLARGHCHVNYEAIPGIVYTDPELASVGRTEDELKQQGVAFRKGEFPFSANGRAKALSSTDGLVKLLADQETDRLLGAHILGPRAGDLIAEVAVAMEFGATSEDLARSCHAHPTLSEALKEAALAVTGSPIHF